MFCVRWVLSIWHAVLVGSGCIKNEEQDQHLYTNLIVGEASMHEGSVAVLAICLCF